MKLRYYLLLGCISGVLLGWAWGSFHPTGFPEMVMNMVMPIAGPLGDIFIPGCCMGGMFFLFPLYALFFAGLGAALGIGSYALLKTITIKDEK